MDCSKTIPCGVNKDGECADCVIVTNQNRNKFIRPKLTLLTDSGVKK